MLKRLSLLSLSVLIPLLAGYRWEQRARAAELAALPVGYQVGQRAPDFDLISVGEKRSLRLSDLRGKPVIVNFYCGCNFCTMVGKEWVKNEDKVGDVALVAVMGNHWSYEPAAVHDYRKNTGWSWPILADLEQQTMLSYHALTCPRVVVIDRDGIIRYASAEGASDEKRLIADALAAARRG